MVMTRRSKWRLTCNQGIVKLACNSFPRDFNQIVSIEDKFGFKHSKVVGAESLRQTLFELELCELAAKGQKFTWMNEHEDDSFIMERLDRAYASIEWINANPHYDLRNQPILRSDHGSIVLDFEVRQPFRKRPFRFERMWLTHADCKNVALAAWSVQANGSRAFKFQQKLKNIRSKFSEWNMSVFGRVENELKIKQRKLQEELETLPIPRLNQSQQQQLDRPVTNEEIVWAVHQLNPHKSPGLDGIPAFFYQEFWGLVKQDVLNYVHAFFHSGTLLKSLNQTYLTLIPKINPLEEVNHFQPISLCNVSYKIISKILVSRLKPYMDRLITPYQNAFVQGRNITDNILIAHEIFDILKRKKGREKGFGVMKIDMCKAYDRVSCNFLKAVPLTMNFSSYWVNLIMECVSSVQFSILVNGCPTKSFKPSRGLRQGDPISPYLFLFCANILSLALSKEEEMGKIKGLYFKLRGRRVADFQDVIDRVQKKLQGWKAKLLSQAGRATLISFVLQALPLYTFSCFRIPNFVCAKLDEIVRCFWWGHNVGDKKLHLVNWYKICQPKERGGLGIKKFNLINQALVAKQFWRIQHCLSSLLAKTFKAKYFPRSSLQDYKPKPHHSWTWRNIAVTQSPSLHQGRWLIGKGFLIPLSHPDWFQTTLQILRDNNLLGGYVADLIDQETGLWKVDLIRRLYQAPIAEEILQIPISKFSNMEDKLVWKFSNFGEYNVKKAYHMLQQNRSPICQDQGYYGIHCSVWKLLWKVKLPMKVLNFIWKLLHDSLLVFHKLRCRGIATSNVCLMCNEDEETANHLFLQCPFARAIWLGSSLGIRTSFSVTSSVYQQAFSLERVQNTSTRQQQGKTFTNYNWNIILKVVAYKNKKTKKSGAAFEALTMDGVSIFLGGNSCGRKQHYLAFQDVVSEAVFKAKELGFYRILILSTSTKLDKLCNHYRKPVWWEKTFYTDLQKLSQQDVLVNHLLVPTVVNSHVLDLAYITTSFPVHHCRMISDYSHVT
ncbi:hypothetical protein SO802_015475 [Lithocarpus litseifolius]|uniref:Reverse transcriptase domain-containing protein n=1 Tax=Lithocarpus litseifolius TaxID=425828 RepID=A0AAW2CUF5_9ROSI